MILNSTSTLSILETTGQILQPGETVNHGDTVQVMCDPDITLGTQYDLYDILETNVTCYDGKLMGELPICPEREYCKCELLCVFRNQLDLEVKMCI